ncbi:STP1 protein [Plasmodium ovale curtisi]|uniref:STP1 protein n=1 Tax=Plasmodium ovale curtisi TaxID=864141 RepID=A0A1A8WBE0_PLAOA|nr:STP1 protein [Plasmodium ovale curtisi]
MERGNYDCKEIIKASKKDSVNVYLPYKTPILQGAIRIITEFKKKKEDGVDYKKLCKELSKYVNVQKGCINPNLKSSDGTTFKKQWKNIIESLNTTFTTQNIVKLCYWEGDKEKKNKERILDLNDKFRKFCIEKKPYEVKSSNMNFEECIKYIQWIEARKKEFQSLDPRYTTIEQYQEYFNIRSNCNYQWLANDKPDMICTRTTRTKPPERNSKGTALGDTTHKTSSDVTHIKVADDHKDTTLASKPPSTENMHNPSTKPPGTGHEQITNKGLPNAGGNINNEPSITKIDISGTPIIIDTPVYQPKYDYKDPKFSNFLESFRTILDGQRIPHYDRHSVNIDPKMILRAYSSKMQGQPVKSTITNSYNSIPRSVLPSKKLLRILSKQQYPASIPRTQSFPASFPPAQPLPSTAANSQPYVTTIPSMMVKRVPKNKSVQTQVSLFHPKINNAVKEEPVIPDPSLFRSPFMIYTLVFLTLFTIITTLFLLSKYTPFGLLFSKKKKKKRLKRQLKIKKIPEESPHFNKINNYLASNIPYENKADTDEKIYNKIKIQKFIIKKNISLKKRKKNKQKTLIDIHMELLNEFKSDEWEMNKNDFLEICLEEFIRAQNEIYANLERNQLIKKNISIQNTKEEKSVLWDKWAERYRPIWENFKSENIFKVLQNKWKEEEKAYLEKVEAENNILNENKKISLIEVRKVIWKMWIAKQAKLIEQYKEEFWIRSLVEELDRVSDEYKNVKDRDDIFLIHIEDVEHKENKGEMHTQDNETFLMKSLIQVLMMIIEECIKQESAGKREVALDTLIGKFNNKKNAKNKLENVENLYSENTNRMKHSKRVEQSKHKNEDNFKEIMEGWTSEYDTYPNYTHDKTKTHKFVL